MCAVAVGAFRIFTFLRSAVDSQPGRDTERAAAETCCEVRGGERRGAQELIEIALLGDGLQLVRVVQVCCVLDLGEKGGLRARCEHSPGRTRALHGALLLSC